MPQQLSPPRLSWRWCAGALLVAIPVVVVAMLRQTVLVASEVHQRSIDFGRPLAWVTQDQTASDAPMPHLASFASPLERPFDVHWLALGLDVLLVWLAFLAAVQAVRLVAYRAGRHRVETESRLVVPGA